MIGAAIGSTLVGAYSANKQAQAAQKGQDQNIEFQRETRDMIVDLTEPQRLAGNNYLAELQAELGQGVFTPRNQFGEELRYQNVDGQHRIQQNLNGQWRDTSGIYDSENDALTELRKYQKSRFETSPGYEFARDEGLNALAAYGSARGTRLGGAAQKEAMRFANGLASQEYGQYLNRLAAGTGIGQTATSQQIGAATNFGNAAGAGAIASSQARGSAYRDMGSAVTGGINALAQYWPTGGGGGYMR